MPSGMTAHQGESIVPLEVAAPIWHLGQEASSDALATALVFRTLASPLRLRILSYLNREGPTHRHRLSTAMSESWSTMEHHLKVLIADGFVLIDGEGLESMYRLRGDLLPRIARLCSPSDL